MRRLVTVALMVTLLVGVGRVAQGEVIDGRYEDDGRYSDRYAVTEDRYVDGFSHPLRIAAYVAAPIGFAAEWLIFRPFHYIISRPHLAPVFNYHPNEDVDIRF